MQNRQNRAVPRMNILLSDQDRARLERLAKLRNRTMSATIAEAVVHLLATVEDGDPVRYVVPSEQEDSGK